MLDKITRRDIIETKSGFTCFPDNAQNEYAKRIMPKEYIGTDGKVGRYFDVAMHGTPSAVSFWAEDTNMSPQFLSNIILHNKKYKKGQRIRLLSCSTGKRNGAEYCFAEELANIMGTEVLAPNEKLYMHSNGEFSIGKYNEGKMVLYRPNNRRRIK